MRERRPLTLDSVPPELVAGISAAKSYLCTESDAILVPLRAVRGPIRKLNREALERLAAWLREGTSIEPIIVYMKGDEAILYDGMHRWQISRAAGFTHIPCRYLETWEAQYLGIA
jgi:hypothetical protein